LPSPGDRLTPETLGKLVAWRILPFSGELHWLVDMAAGGQVKALPA